LFYAVNGLGLGHVTRLMAIAHAVRIQRPAAQILFLTTTEADNVIHREGFASVKVPSRSVIAEARIRPPVFHKLVQTVCLNTVAAFNPAILVADTFPGGSSQELLPTLGWEMRRAFVFREQRQAPSSDPAFQSVLSRYDLCIVPHTEGTVQLTLPPRLKSVYTGPILIRSRDSALPRDDARARLGLPADAEILYVSFGGGGDTEISDAIEAVIAAAANTPWKLALADAPLSRMQMPPGVQSVRYYPIAECFLAFDAAVSAAGYNSVHELLHFGVPSALVPFPRSLDDQERRVADMVNAGAAISAFADTESLTSALMRLLDPTLRAHLSAAGKRLVPESGADKAAEAILGLL
jgi:UDP:flavonoid glycosyltransferase YjiC (YdhE family)